MIGPGTPYATSSTNRSPTSAAAPRRHAPRRLARRPRRASPTISSPLAGDLDDAWQIERPDDVRAAAFGDAIVFVSSDAPRAAIAVLLAGDGATSLRDPFTGEHLPAVAGKVTIAMPPRGVRMFVVER